MNITFTDAVLFGAYFILLFLAIFWLLVFLSSGSQSPRKGKKEKLTSFPFFTAIVPAKNEEATILGTLQSLLELDYPHDRLEIIVSVNGSSDNTAAVVGRFIKDREIIIKNYNLNNNINNINPVNNNINDHNLDNDEDTAENIAVQNIARNIVNKNIIITLLNSSLANKAAAMNRALAVSKGEFFACLDADSIIHSSALQEMLPYFAADENVAAVCPLMKVKAPKSVLQKVQWYEYIINMFYKFLNSRLDAVHVTPGPFSVYKTAVIKSLGGYDEQTITEDLEIAIRLQKHHYKIVQTFDAIVETAVPTTWRALFRQRVRWYKGSVDNSLRYRKLIFNKNYGDFGMIRMPTIILGGLVAIILLFTFLRELLLHGLKWLASARAISFDYWTVLAGSSLQVHWLNLPLFKIVIAATLLSISFWVMVQSYRLVKEDIRNHGRTLLSLITYLVIYSFFISVVWVYILFVFLTGKKNRWS